MDFRFLDIIRKFYKIGLVLSRICYISCVVVLVLGIFTIISMNFGFANSIKLGDITFYEVLSERLGMSDGSIYVMSAVWCIYTLGEFIVSLMAARYFKHELRVGDPFTKLGSRKLLKLGICTIVIPILAVIVAKITYSVMDNFLDGVQEMNIKGFITVGLGIAMIGLAYVFNYIAGIKDKFMGML